MCLLALRKKTSQRIAAGRLPTHHLSSRSDGICSARIEGEEPVGRIDDLPPHFLDEHTNWHHNIGTGGASFLQFHGDFVQRVLQWYGTNRPEVWP
jgi:hypothetical protein